jgi:hypothetical protein
MSRNEPYNIIWTGANTTSANELAIAIAEFLGTGLDEQEWKHKLEAKGWTYDKRIRNAIIHQEFVYFIPEIKRLLAEPNTAQDSSKAILVRVFSSELGARNGSRELQTRRQKG